MAAARVAVAHDGTRRQPLFAIYRRESIDAKSALNDDLAVWRWQDMTDAIEVNFSDVPGAFFNLNTEDDFGNWRERERG